jgi:hypothetical protein
MRHIPYHPLALSFTICLWEAKDHARNELSGCMDEEDLHLLLSRMADRYDWTDDQQADLYARLVEAVTELEPTTFLGMQSVITDALITNRDIYGK